MKPMPAGRRARSAPCCAARACRLTVGGGRAGKALALAKPRGPRGRRRDPVANENERLRQENARLRQRLEQAEAILEIQKKASEILGIPLNRSAHGDDA